MSAVDMVFQMREVSAGKRLQIGISPKVLHTVYRIIRREVPIGIS